MGDARHIDDVTGLDLFRKSDAGNLFAEVFLDELQFILEEDVLDRVIVRNRGMNPRVESKDILDAGLRQIYPLGECVELTLARNSIYHQLPEFLFHPLTLGRASMTSRELVDAIRENKRKEKEAIDFFSPFDTAFFRERVKVHRRYLNFYSDSGSHRNLGTLMEMVLGKELSLTKEARYKLFFFVCRAELYKEELSQIEHILREVMGIEVKLRYVPCVVTQIPYSTLGDGMLGIDIGLGGEVETETDDIKATLVYHNTIPEAEKVERHMRTAKGILEYFILSTRHTHVEYTLEGRIDFILGENRLGYDTHL